MSISRRVVATCKDTDEITYNTTTTPVPIVICVQFFRIFATVTVFLIYCNHFIIEEEEEEAGCNFFTSFEDEENNLDRGEE
jgi:hypothetical protein